MIDIEEYMKLSKIERQGHIKLDEPCVIRNEGCYAILLKGLLAHVLDTTIPLNGKVLVCHACHTGNCSNPLHIYWGTSKENKADEMSLLIFKNVWERTVAKYGEEEAHKKISGKTWSMTPEQLQKHSDKIKRLHAEGRFKHVDRKHSQLGLRWLKKDGIEIRVKKDLLGSYLKEGWKNGRVIHPVREKFHWITKDGINKRAILSDIEALLVEGWVRGRAAKNVVL